jgi:hypothetical protein
MADIITISENTYKKAIMHSVQQEGTLLRDACEVGKVQGEYLYIDELNAMEAFEVLSKYADTQTTEHSWERRRTYLRRFTVAPMLDTFDEVAIATKDPKSPLVEGTKRAMNRRMDDLIIEAFDADVQTGHTGGSTTTFDSNNIITCATGLDLASLRAAEEKLITNEVWDLDEPRYLVIGPKQLNDLRQIDQYNSIDYNNLKSLSDGARPPFLGFNIIVSNRLGLDDSGNRKCFAWTKSAMMFGIGKDVQVKIAELPTKNYAWQVFTEAFLSAVRSYEEGVLMLACTES